jgi:hypothetical protein
VRRCQSAWPGRRHASGESAACRRSFDTEC